MQQPSPRHVVRRRGPQPHLLGSFVAKLTGKAFEKYGFSAVALLTDWRTIVGADLADCTQPDRLKWPRNVDAYTETAAADRGRPGATLVLRVDSGRSLDVQYRSAEIIDRINAYFGYRAVAELRFIQAPIEPARPLPDRTAPQHRQPAATSVVEPASAQSSQSSQSSLDAALARLEASVCGNTQRSDRARNHA